MPLAKHHIPLMPVYYDRYIAAAPDGDLEAVLGRTLDDGLALLAGFAGREGHRYAPGKWSVNEVVQHVIDTERIMAWRALCLCRGEPRELPEYDEDAYAATYAVDGRPLADLAEEFALLRRSHQRFFAALTVAEGQRSGSVAGKAISVVALGYVIAGHARHHLGVLAERYRPGA